MLNNKIIADLINSTNGNTYSNRGGEYDGVIPNYPKNEDGSGFSFDGSSVGSIFSTLLPYVFVIAGIILLVMLIMGGLGLMTAAGNPDKMKAGYGRITNALIGFLIIFVSYFVMQLVETILRIKIM